MLKNKVQIIGVGLVVAFFITLLVCLSIGAFSIPLVNIIGMVCTKLGLNSETHATNQEAVFWVIRFPRVLVGGLIGAALSLSGACLQGLFRNPLADPGLIGISAGASIASSALIVLAGSLWIGSYYGLSLFSFLGSITTTFLIYRISKIGNQTSVTTMLLAGIAINAIGGAFTGIMTYISNEAQLRSLTFWLLGSLGGANWQHATTLLPFILIPALYIPRLGKQLDLFTLGENDAAYSGVNTSKLKVQVIILSTMAVGASVAISGIISFIGLVVPHLLRLIIGPNHKFLLPYAMLLGAILLMISDLIARTILAPTELPIGIITAIIGTPIFLWIVIKEKRKQLMI